MGIGWAKHHLTCMFDTCGNGLLSQRRHLQRHFLGECVYFDIIPKIVAKISSENKLALIQVMACRWPGDNIPYKPIMAQIINAFYFINTRIVMISTLSSLVTPEVALMTTCQQWRQCWDYDSRFSVINYTTLIMIIIVKREKLSIHELRISVQYPHTNSITGSVMYVLETAEYCYNAVQYTCN